VVGLVGWRAGRPLLTDTHPAAHGKWLMLLLGTADDDVMSALLQRSQRTA
jgi:hypothetical protein